MKGNELFISVIELCIRLITEVSELKDENKILRDNLDAIKITEELGM